MSRQRPILERCTIAFDTTVRAKDKPISVGNRSESHAVRWLEDGRIGAAATSGPMRDELVQTAREMARFGPAVGADFFDGMQRVIRQASRTPEEIADWLHRLEQRLAQEALQSDFLIRTTKRVMRLRLQEEVITEIEDQSVFCSVAFRPRDGSGVVRLSNSFLGDLPEPEAFLQNRLWQGMGLPQQRVESGRYEVLFTPSAFAILFDLLLALLNGQIARVPGVAFAAAEPGRVFLHPSVTVRPTSVPGRADDEGIPSSGTPLVERGVWRGAYNDRFTAERHGQLRTGNGYRSWQASDAPALALPRPQCPFARLEPGEETEDELIKRMEKGLVITAVSPAVNRDFLVAPLRLPVLQGWYVERGRVTAEVIAEPVLTTGVLDLFRSALVMSSRTQLVQGKQIPWVYAPEVTVLSPA